MKRSIRQSNSVVLLSSYSEEMKFLPEESLTGIMRLHGRHERMRTKLKLDRARADWSQLPSVTGSIIRRSVSDRNVSPYGLMALMALWFRPAMSCVLCFVSLPSMDAELFLAV